METLLSLVCVPVDSGLGAIHTLVWYGRQTIGRQNHHRNGETDSLVLRALGGRSGRDMCSWLNFE